MEEQNSLHKDPSTEERDQLNRSTKKSKRKITHLIFNHEQEQQQSQERQTAKIIPNTTKTNGNPWTSRGVSFRDMVAFESMQTSTGGQEDEEEQSDDDEPPENLVDDPRCPIILLSKEEKQRLRRPWKHALIIKMFDSKIGYMSLMKRLKKKWELTGGLILTDIGHDYFIARFSNIGDYNHVLTQGPWMLDDNYLTIRKWVPNFIPDNQPMRFLTAWVRIPHLSVEYFDKEFLRKIGGKIGKVARIDNNTAMAQRGKFTRLSVELDLTKPLLSKFWLKGKIWKVQYEGLMMICFHCGRIGHLGETCSSKLSMLVEDPQDNTLLEDKTEEPIQSPVEQQDFGSWMMVKKPPPRRRTARPEKQQPEASKGGQGREQIAGQKNTNQGEKIGGSRFSILCAQNQETEDTVNRNPVNLGSSEGDILTPNLATIHLGQTSQVTTIPTANKIFNIGTSHQNTNIRAQFLGNSKQWQEIRKQNKTPPNSILNDRTNELEPISHKSPSPSVLPGKENTPIIFQARSEARPIPSLAILDTPISSPHIESSISHVSPTPSPDHHPYPLGKDHMCGILNGGPVHGNNRPPDPYTGDGDSLMDTTNANDARTDANLEASQSA